MNSSGYVKLFTLSSGLLLLLVVIIVPVQSFPVDGEIEVDFDTTRQSIVRANQLLASINRDVDLCLTNSVACTLKSYDDADDHDETFLPSNSYSGSNNNEQPATTTDYMEADEVNVTLPSTMNEDSTSPPVMTASHYGRVPPINIVVPPSSDQKFTHVLNDIDSLEAHVQLAITNFTTTRRFTYTAMLKPMIKHIHQLRNNLSLLHHRLIGVAALTNIASQVNELTDHISDALVGGSDIPSDDSVSIVTSSSPSPSPATSSSPSSSSEPTSTSTSSSTTPTLTSVINQSPVTTIDNQSAVSSPTVKSEPIVSSTTSTTQSPSSNPTVINELIVESTTKPAIDLINDVVEEIATPRAIY